MSETSARKDSELRKAASGGGVWEQVSTLLLAVVIALAIRTFVIEPYRIPSESMVPTLLVGDHLFVNKFVYGIKFPFTDLRLPGLREPGRGDVVGVNQIVALTWLPAVDMRCFMGGDPDRKGICELEKRPYTRCAVHPAITPALTFLAATAI